MRKNGKSDLWFAGNIVLMLAIIAVLLFNCCVILLSATKNSGIMPTKNSIWEENPEDKDSFNMFKIIKKYRIRSI